MDKPKVLFEGVFVLIPALIYSICWNESIFFYNFIIKQGRFTSNSLFVYTKPR